MITLYPEYQIPAYQKLVNHFKTNAVALLVMATGLGKTIVAAFWAKREYKKNRKGLFLCHDTGILDQARDEFHKVMGHSVATKTFFGTDKDWSADKGDVVFATFQTLRDCNPFFTDEFHFIIVDESHHGQAPTYKEVIQYFTPKKILGITATPNREDMQDIRDIFGDEVVDISLEEAIANGWLSQVKYHILNDNLSHWKLKKIVKGVLEEGKRISVKQLNETIFIKARDDKTAHTIQNYARGKKKVIIFCENILHAENFQKFLPHAEVYHSKKSKKHNRKVLQDFREGKIQFILTVNNMNEGIDVPDAEVIVFLRCTDSKTIFFQQLGRGLRKLLKKKKVIVLDFVANCERVAMVQKLAREIKEYAGNHFELTKDVLHVSGESFDFIFSDEQIDILEVIRQIKAPFYPTWQEASVVVQRIDGIVNQNTYKKFYRSDKRLPSSPRDVYHDFPGWIVFLGGKEKYFYPTWQEAGIAVVKLGIKNSDEYKILYKEDEQLPSSPWTYYDDFPGETRFFGKKKKYISEIPRLAQEYSSKNDIPMEKIVTGSNRKVLWTCLEHGHEWMAVVYSRTGKQESNCPECGNRIVGEENSLAKTHPDLAKEYSPKNELPASKVIAGTGKLLWWKCSVCNSEWPARGAERVKGKSGCPECAKRNRKKKS